MILLNGVVCDPFWTASNAGACSDEFGRYLKPDGGVVTDQEIMQTVGGSRPPAGGPAGDGSAWLRENAILVAGGFLALTVGLSVMKGRR